MVIDKLPTNDFHGLVADLNRLSQQYPEPGESDRLVRGMGWSRLHEKGSNDSPAVVIDVIGSLAYLREQSTKK